MNDINIEDLKNKYKLSQEEFEKMYERCEYVTFFNCKPQEKPTAVFIGGQTGAGKGGIDIYFQKKFNKNNQNIAALLDVDVYRALYPYTKEIIKKYPTMYTTITAEVTGKILKRLMNKAISNNYNFIFEGTLKNTEALETIKQMPKYYNKIIAVMATSYIESLLTAFERNYEQVNITGYGRFTNVETHNLTYDGVLNTIKQAEQMKEDICINIFGRGIDMTNPKILYSNKESKEKPSKVLDYFREKDLEKEKDKSKDRLEELIKILSPKDEFEVIQLEKLKMIITGG